jgi:hypothetical protein
MTRPRDAHAAEDGVITTLAEDASQPQVLALP